MTPQEALAQALKRQADEAGEWCDEPMEVAAAVLAALPEGWWLMSHGACPLCVEQGAGQERERLRKWVSDDLGGEGDPSDTWTTRDVYRWLTEDVLAEPRP